MKNRIFSKENRVLTTPSEELLLCGNFSNSFSDFKHAEFADVLAPADDPSFSISLSPMKNETKFVNIIVFYNIEWNLFTTLKWC